ncbi:MAG: STAS domain-containing protein [Desulfobulbaceae bacterium]|nr:STAS domain-containing protein [Desulfobulbaceae bacterium]
MSEVSREGEKAIVKPDQNIVVPLAKDFKGELKELLHDGITHLIINMEDVNMIDSEGLSVLIAAQNSLQKLGTSLELFNVSENIRKLLQNMRLDKRFIIQDS